MIDCKGPFGGFYFQAGGVGRIPGAILGVGGVFDDMDVLGGHIALGEQKDAMAVVVFCDVDYEHGVAGVAAFDKDVAGPDRGQRGRYELVFERMGAAPGKDVSQVKG